MQQRGVLLDVNGGLAGERKGPEQVCRRGYRLAAIRCQ
jgi:hypothetical protein